MEGKNFSVRGNRASAYTDFAHSPNIWQNCPMEAIRRGEIAGHYIDLNFMGGGLITSPTTEAALVGYPLSGFGSAGSSHAYADAVGGGLVMATAATDNLATMFRTKGCPFQIAAKGTNAPTGGTGRLWFEARVKVSSITDNALGWILGLYSDVTMTVDIPLSSANPPIMATTVNFVGFRAPEEDAGMVKFTYDTNDTAQATNAEVVVSSSFYQGVADTYMNIGLMYDPLDADRVNSGRPTLSAFVNNIRDLNVVTVPNAETGADLATFPSGYRLGLGGGIKNGAGTAHTMTLQWIKCYQEQL